MPTGRADRGPAGIDDQHSVNHARQVFEEGGDLRSSRSVKLHAAVLASAANVPCVVLEYQPKCLDFAASIGWERFTIRTSQLTADQLIDKTALLVEQLGPARQELTWNVSRLERQFEEYCRRIEPLILGKGAAGYPASPSRTAAGWGA